MYDLENSFFVCGELTIENLRRLNFCRATYWSTFLNQMTLKSKEEDPNVALNIEKLDEFYGLSDEEASDSDCYDDNNIDKAIETNYEILNVSFIEKNVTMTNAQNILALIEQNPNTTGITNEDRQYLEQTLPFFGNYKRELRIYGFDKVLCTFNEAEIEKKAGKMLAHAVQQNVPLNNRKSQPAIAVDDTDSDSIDIARYVRSSKKECKLRKLSAKKRTTIKSYRMIKKKREELYKKYSYLASD